MTNNHPLPVLLSIPHGGTKRPPELDGYLCITEHDQFDDSDPFVIEIFDLGDKVAKVIKTDIARAFVDLNRSPEDLPPKNPDGLIKSKTCYEKPIYIQDKHPDESLIHSLIEKYYKPYHNSIEKSIHELDLKLCLDCHSMASVAPNISPDRNSKNRPLFCLSNQDCKTSTKQMIELLADSIAESFCISKDQISINDPFHGGYITKSFGNDPVPWIQVEMNRSLYLDKEWFDVATLNIDTSRLQQLNQMFTYSLDNFFKTLEIDIGNG